MMQPSKLRKRHLAFVMLYITRSCVGAMFVALVALAVLVLASLFLPVRPEILDVVATVVGVCVALSCGFASTAAMLDRESR